jgi:methionyl-tRNA formyltransferase
VSYAAKIGKSEARIDWQRSAIQIDRQVRAFNPWPVAETRFAGDQLRIISAHMPHAIEPNPAAIPGTVTAVLDDAVVVQCGEGSLALTRVQRPGRRPVSAREFARGRALLGQALG